MPIAHTQTFNKLHVNTDGSSTCLKFDGLHSKLRKQHDHISSSNKNFVVADFSIIFQTTAGKVLSLSVPIRDNAWQSFGYESLKLYNEVSTMSKFYKAHKDIGGKGTFNPQSHGHSEAYLYYYLQSPHRLAEILNHLKNRGLQANKIQQVMEAQLHICSTNSMCATCSDLTSGTEAKQGFIDSFSPRLQHALLQNNLQVAPNFTVQICPSYTKDYGHKTDVVHLQPSYTLITPDFSNILKRLEAITYLNYLRTAKHQSARSINYDEAKRFSLKYKATAETLLMRESLIDRLNVPNHQHATNQNTRHALWISQLYAHTGFVSSSKDVSKSRVMSKDEQVPDQDLASIAHKTILKFFKTCKQKKEEYQGLVDQSYLSSGL